MKLRARVKMKITGLNLIISFIVLVELGSCSLGASMNTQFTSMNTGCSTENIQISNEKVELSGAETWTAICDGKTYDCNYFPDADANCYLRED
jgi:hypothetical protein